MKKQKIDEWSSFDSRKFHISYSLEGTGKDFDHAAFSYRLIRTKMTLETLMEWQVKRSGGVVPALLIEPEWGRKLFIFAGHELLFVDIDGNWSLEEFKKRFRHKIALLYTTSSHGVHKKDTPFSDRFRAVLILPFSNTSLAVALLLQRAANTVFESDPAVRSPLHVICGTNNPKISEIFGEKEPNILDVDWLIGLYIQIVGISQVQKEIAEICKQTLRSYTEFLEKSAGIESPVVTKGRVLRESEIPHLEKGNLDAVLRNLANNAGVDLSIQLPIGRFSTSPTPKRSKKQPATTELDMELIFADKNEKNVDLQLLRKECKLLESPSDANHMERMHLIWNLRKVVGGLKYLRKLIKEQSLEKEWSRLPEFLKTARNNGYQRSGCAGRCRYFGTDHCISPYSIVDLTKKKGEVRVTEVPGIERQPLAAARKAFQTQMTEILKSPDSDTIVVNAITGIGKTHVISQFIENDLMPEQRQTVIASPTHAVIDGYATGARFSVLSEGLKEKFEPFYESGILPDRYLSKSEMTAEQRKEYKARKEERPALLNENLLHVTHSRLSLDTKLPEPDLLIIDEDFFNQLLPLGSSSRSGLRRAINLFGSDDRTKDVAELLTRVLNAKGGIVHPMAFLSEAMDWEPYMELLADELKASKGHFSPGNIQSLLLSRYFLWSGEHLHWIGKRQLPSAGRTIIASATADTELLSLALPDRRITSFQAPLIQPRGNLVQFSGASFSSGSLIGNKERREQFDAITEYCAENGFACISYPSNSIAEAPVHFYDASGRNDLAGKDLVVIGTPNPPDYYIQLTAAALGLPASDIKSYSDLFKNGGRMPRVAYEAMGYKFDFNYPALSDDPRLWAIQRHFIYSLLMQAVGRARYYEYPCNVYLFSAFPIPDFTLNPTSIREIVTDLPNYLPRSQQ